MMGRSGVVPELPVALEQAAMRILELMADPDRLKQAVKDLGDASKEYQAAKTAADEKAADFDARTKAAAADLDKRMVALEKAETEFNSRMDGYQARLDAVKEREDAMTAREAKIRAALT